MNVFFWGFTSGFGFLHELLLDLRFLEVFGLGVCGGGHYPPRLATRHCSDPIGLIGSALPKQFTKFKKQTPNLVSIYTHLKNHRKTVARKSSCPEERWGALLAGLDIGLLSFAYKNGVRIPRLEDF